MAVTAQKLYDWLLKNWSQKISLKSVSALPASGTFNTIYFMGDKFYYWDGVGFINMGVDDHAYREEIADRHQSVIDVAERDAMPDYFRAIYKLVTYRDAELRPVTSRYDGSDISDAQWTDPANWTDITATYEFYEQLAAEVDEKADLIDSRFLTSIQKAGVDNAGTELTNTNPLVTVDDLPKQRVHAYVGTFIPNDGFPTTGTGEAGAVLKGNLYKASSAGTITGIGDLQAGDFIIALIDTPGIDPVNWSFIQGSVLNWENVYNKPDLILQSEKGAPNGVATTDADGLVPVAQIPDEVKESKVVADIAARDALVAYESLRVHVLDATADPNVTSGGAGYIYHNLAWIKTYEEEGLDVVVNWSDVQNKPTSTVANIDDAVNKKHTQGTDYYLDFGGTFQVSAEQTKTAYTHSQATHAPVDANKNVQVDWNQTDSLLDSFIKNKPDLSSLHSHTNAIVLANLTASGSGSVITSVERTKLTNIEDGAQVNVQSDWAVTDTAVASHIKNKPAEKAVEFVEFDLTDFIQLVGQSANFTISIPANYRITSIVIEETAAAAAGDIVIGTTNGGNDVVNNETIGASALVDCAVGKSLFSKTTAQTLYVNSNAWGTGAITIDVRIEKISA